MSLQKSLSSIKIVGVVVSVFDDGSSLFRRLSRRSLGVTFFFRFLELSNVALFHPAFVVVDDAAASNVFPHSTTNTVDCGLDKSTL